MAQQYGQYKKPKQDSIEVKIVLGFFRGIAWFFRWLFTGAGGAKPAKPRIGAVNTEEITRRWSDIQTSVGLGGVTHFGSAVVAADKLLDHVLKQKGYGGDTMGERLRNAESDLTRETYQNAWQAHKLRNQLVHEVESEVVSFQAKEAIQSFEQILRELGALR